MEANSRFIQSAQTGPHADLEKLLKRHLETPFRRPILDYNRQAFDEAIALWQRDGKKRALILDAGCGVGWSTCHIARLYPDCFVLGVDQSSDRLARGKPLDVPENAALIRADLVDFWRLLADAQIRLHRHFLLYPNPWPKIGHLARRWHGHAVFPILKSLGGVVECRSNWEIYVQEMAWALGILANQSVSVEPWLPEMDMTPFEKKYRLSGHTLWRCQVDFS